MYDFTACIVTYNTKREELKKIIGCFKNVNLNFKLWISDNSEKDSLKDFIEELNDNRIEYIFNNSNKGFGAGHNVIIEKLVKDDIISKYHLIINADIVFCEGTIEKLYRYMEKHEDIGQIGPKIKGSDGELNYSCKLLPTPFNLIFRRFLPFRKLLDKMDYEYEMRWYDYKDIMEVPVLSGCFMFIRREAFKNVGKFDERYFMYMEDYDLCRRIGEKYKVVCYPLAEIVHEHGKASYKSRKMMMIHAKSAIKYFNKWGWIFDGKRKKINREHSSSLSK